MFKQAFIAATACAVGAHAGNLRASDLTYAESDGYRMANYALAAYESQSDLYDWNCDACSYNPQFAITSVVDDSKYDVQCFVGYDSTSDTAIVSFRGTVSTSIQDWIDDLSFTTTKPFTGDYSDAKVHHGFWNSYEALSSGILTALGTIGASSVEVTGHSLGGAMATLCAFDLQNYQGYKVTEVMTFGSPRVGDKTFAKYADALPMLRVTNYHDIVPHVPEELLGFYHVGPEVWYEDRPWASGDFKTCDSGEDSSCSNSCSPVSCTSVSDHLSYYGYDW